MAEGSKDGEADVLSSTRARLVGQRRMATRFAVCLAVAFVLGSAGGASVSYGSREQAAPALVRVGMQGTAHGSVVSIPRGIDCRPSCIAKFRRGAQLVLVAGSRASSRFAGWSGGCVGRSVTCVLVAADNTSVTARFVPATGHDVGGAIQTKYFLSVTKSGPGKVRSSPHGIDCPSRCEKSFRKGTNVTLRAAAPNRYRVAWGSLSASCGDDSCVARMDANANVSVAFVKA
jgi:hypothetical protein